MSPTPRMDREEAVAYLLGRIDYERVPQFPYHARTLKLDRMRDLLRRIGDPQMRYPVVHIAGTKGKGSTSAMLASILTEAGYRTGLYTSPHLEQIEERMTIDGRLSSGNEFADLLSRVRIAVEAMDQQTGSDEQGPTYFEITTAAAMLHFADCKVDAAVLEVGLGGRLDSTNVCQSKISVITSISFDHMRQLGNTLAKIAGEKAGIIKPGVPVISGVTEEEPAAVIRERARRLDCPYFELGKDFQVDYHGSRVADSADDRQHAAIMARFHFEDASGRFPANGEPLSGALPGRHQASNAAVAIATCLRLRNQQWQISDDAICAGLRKVRVPARTELIQSRPAVIVDSAHNAASIHALLDLLDEAFPANCPRILIFATSRDKDLSGMLQRLVPKFGHIILTRYMNNPRYVEPAELKQLADPIAAEMPETSAQILIEPSPAAAWSAAEAFASEKHLICVTGSFFLAAEIRRLAQESPLRAGGSPP